MTRCPASLVAVLLVVSSATAQSPMDLMRYFPTQHNSVCIVNVGQLLESPRAVREKWNQIDHAEYLAGAVPVHPNVLRLVSMCEYDPSHKNRTGAVAVLSTRQ